MTAARARLIVWLITIFMATGLLAESAAVSLFDIPATLDDLRVQAAGLREQLTALPDLSDSLQFDAFGYHGGYLPKLKQVPQTPRWTVNVSFIHYLKMEQIILVPALDQRFDRLRSYGFPKRFRVSLVFSDGSTAVVKEWLTEDCPNPGRMPLIIDLPATSSNQVRIEVFRGAMESGKEFFALDELFGVAPDQVIYRAEKVSASSEFESLPYWSKEFLIDQKTGLGLPLGVASETVEVDAGDFKVVFDSAAERTCVVELDLGRNQKLGWITLFPAVPSEGIVIPGYGFPGHIDVDLIWQKKTGERGQSSSIPLGWKNGNPGNNAVRLAGFGRTGRWVRLTMRDFPIHKGHRTFAMGEINVFKRNKIYPIQHINMEGIPIKDDAAVSSMFNRISNGQPIMFLLDWLHQIEQRNQRTRALEKNEAERSVLTQRWRRFWMQAGVGVLLLMVLIASTIAVLAVRHRRHHAERLRRQINSDLHDDIGSKVAAISLASTFLERSATEVSARETGTRIHTIATAMHQGLRDVLWLTDTETDTLDQLVQKLAHCARIGVAPERLVLEMTPASEISTRAIRVQIKRDLLLFFREALCNAAKHSSAPEIRVGVHVQGRKLTLSVQDQGCGFQMPAAGFNDSFHHGLLTMNERSKRLNGQLEITSAPSEGTTVKLCVSV